MAKRAMRQLGKGLEQLEARRLMAASVTYDAQTRALTIVGDQYADALSVRFEGSVVQGNLVSQSANGTSIDIPFSRNIAEVSTIKFDALAGYDTLVVSQGVLSAGVSLANTRVEFLGGLDDDVMRNMSSVRSTAFGGGGDDNLLGGSATDVLHGDSEKDNLDGGGGVDYVFGDFGADTIRGSTGADFLYGGEGNDWIDGEWCELLLRRRHDFRRHWARQNLGRVRKRCDLWRRRE
jgi:Ca2+-binding RTX toxin-like protein